MVYCERGRALDALRNANNGGGSHGSIPQVLLRRCCCTPLPRLLPLQLHLTAFGSDIFPFASCGCHSGASSKVEHLVAAHEARGFSGPMCVCCCLCCGGRGNVCLGFSATCALYKGQVCCSAGPSRHQQPQAAITTASETSNRQRHCDFGLAAPTCTYPRRSNATGAARCVSASTCLR